MDSQANLRADVRCDSSGTVKGPIHWRRSRGYMYFNYGQIVAARGDQSRCKEQVQAVSLAEPVRLTKLSSLIDGLAWIPGTEDISFSSRGILYRMARGPALIRSKSYKIRMELKLWRYLIPAGWPTHCFPSILTFGNYLLEKRTRSAQSGVHRSGCLYWTL